MWRDEWEFEDIPYGGDYAQRAAFSIRSHEYIALFPPIPFEDKEYLSFIKEMGGDGEFGFELPKETHEVSFDLKRNHESGNFLQIEERDTPLSVVLELGKVLCELIHAHCKQTGTKAYIFAVDSENLRLKSLYDRLTKRYTPDGYHVICTGTNGTKYVIQTPNF